MSVVRPSEMAPGAQSSQPYAPIRTANASTLLAGDAASSKVWKWLIILVSVGSNAALLIGQQVAFRLLAPLIGSSIETWSTIIGVFLLGIAIGNWIAGRLADRFSPVMLIAGSLFTGAGAVFLMPVLADWLAGSAGFASLSLTLQIMVASLVVCLLPGILLSLVTQPSIRSVVTRADEIGSASGRIFAWGTFGSLAGNYAAGFVLLALLGVRMIVNVTGWSLMVMALFTIVAGRRLSGGVAGNPSSQGNLAANEATAIGAVSATETAAERTWIYKAILTVFACSFVSGALEGAAFRILAPLVGVSMFLTAGVVGVVLAGMSLGNALGGKIATRHGTRTALRYSLTACASTTLVVAPIWKMATQGGVFNHLPLIPQILLWSFSLFFLPALALGTITPQVIRLSVPDVRSSGSVSGLLYAWSTVGCIAGILMSAWLMIEAFGAIRTSILCGMIPVLLIWLTSRSASQKEQMETRALSGVLIAMSVVLLVVCKSPYDRESKYFSLNVRNEVIDNREVKVLALDRLVHSVIDLKDPGFLYYPHERVQGDFTRAAATEARAAGRTPRVLVIGGGGYTFPRWIEAQADLSDVEIDVVEIDPAVTGIAQDRLGLSRSSRIVSIHMDGRQFVKTAPAASYDLVIQDAVNDFSVPYHLMTTEYNSLIQRLLRTDGVYMLTVIDSMESGRFLASAVRTMQSAFGDTNLLAPPETAFTQGRNVFVIAGREADSSSDSRAAWWTDRTAAHIFPFSEVDPMLQRNAAGSPILTDDYAPVDILMTGHFLQGNQ